MDTNLTIISPLSWVQDAFKSYFDKAHMTDSSHSAIAQRLVAPTSKPTKATQPESGNSHGNRKDYNQKTTHWNVTYDYGFEPVRSIADNDAVWITADLLIAQNTWRARYGFPPILLEAPSADWLAKLPKSLTGRTVITTTVCEIRKWDKLPDGLGERPWSQLSLGRVPEFRAARRNLAELQHDLQDAPDDSLITVNAHVAGITEEWCVIIRNGQAVTSSGYCVHLSPDEDSHDILTVFDNAKFHDSYRALAESTATEAAQASHLGNSSILVGFRNTTEQKSAPSYSAALPQALVLEADPVWCTTPYPYESPKESDAFLDAIADSRLRYDTDGTLKNRVGDVVASTDVYSPDPWMVRYAAHRYDRF